MLTGEVTGFDGVYFANIGGPVSGGSDLVIHVVTEEDLTAAREGAIAQLSTLAASYRLPDGRIVIPSTVQPAGEPSVEMDHAAGDQTDTFAVSAQATFQGLVIDPNELPEDVETSIRERIAPQIPEGYALTDGTILFSDPAEQAPGQPILTISASIDAAQVLSDDQKEQVREAVAGKSVDDAREALAAMPGLEVVDISVSPSLLVKSLPGEGRIEVSTG
jgi:hypothetical protein